MRSNSETYEAVAKQCSSYEKAGKTNGFSNDCSCKTPSCLNYIEVLLL